jgi:TolA-binding protein
MSPARKRALVLALGASAATAAVVVSAGAPAASTAATKTTAALVLKWLGTAVVGSALVAGAGFGAAHVMSQGVTTRRAPAVAIGAPPPESRASAAPILTAAPIPTTTTALLPDAVEDAPPQPRSSVVTRHAPPSSTASRPGLSDEVRLVERARTALHAGDLASARTALDEHTSQFPRGALADEVAVLRIDILVRSGDRPSAERAARLYLAAHPTSPHAPRLRDLLEGGSK